MKALAQIWVCARSLHSPGCPRSPKFGKGLVPSWVGFSQKTRPYFEHEQEIRTNLRNLKIVLVYYLTPLQKQECVVLEHTVYCQRGGGPSIKGPLSLFFCLFIFYYFFIFYILLFFKFFWIFWVLLSTTIHLKILIITKIHDSTTNTLSVILTQISPYNIY